MHKLLFRVEDLMGAASGGRARRRLQRRTGAIVVREACAVHQREAAPQAAACAVPDLSHLRSTAATASSDTGLAR